MTVWHSAIGYIFDERRAAPPAYVRRAWSKVVSYLGFFINFPKLIRVQALPEYQNGFNEQGISILTIVAPLWSNFVGIKPVQNVDFSRVSKMVLWTDCFRWPEGPAETI